MLSPGLRRERAEDALHPVGVACTARHPIPGRRRRKANAKARRRAWRGGRVVEGARLESVYTGNGIAGSNPAPSASRLSNACHRLPSVTSKALRDHAS